jgi:hypothetical protein
MGTEISCAVRLAMPLQKSWMGIDRNCLAQISQKYLPLSLWPL